MNSDLNFRATRYFRATLIGIGALAATVGMAACASHPAGPAAAGSRAAARVSLAPHASAQAAASAVSRVPAAGAWLAASEIPFGATYNWSLFTGTANSAPIGAAESNGVYYVSPETVFQATTTCGDPSLIIGSPLGAWQRQFKPTTGALYDLAGQFISAYPDAAAAQAAWQRLQAAYAGCVAQAPSLQITLTETAKTQDAMAWRHSADGARSPDVAPYAHEYFVLHNNMIAYLYVEGADPALAATPDDSQILAAIAQHLTS